MFAQVFGLGRVVLPLARQVAILVGTFAALAVSVGAQSQALNGRIEGSVSDLTGSVIPNAVISVTNIETGATRTATTDENGVFRFPLLPLGTYRITAEANNFRKAIQEGVILNAGQTAVIHLTIQAGDIKESVTVSSDAPAADAGKIELGRVMNSREVQNLPLITLNPVNFVFLQSNVTGNRTAVPGLGFANVNANGFSRRGSYLMDGNYATDAPMGGVRMLFFARPDIQEIQLVTNGMNAEFGWTVGHVMNVITPSGTNAFRGDVSYQFRRQGFASQRFNVPPGTPKYDPNADVVTASFGGPIIKDRWHLYVGFEAFKWDLASAQRQINITEANKQTLIDNGLPAEIMPSSYPAPEVYGFYIGRTDAQLDPSNRLAVRFLLRDGKTERTGVGAFPGNTLQMTADNHHLQHSLAAQLVSHKGDSLFNEFRFQRSTWDSSSTPNEFTGTGDITIRIIGVASFGAHPNLLAEFRDSTLDTLQNNISILSGDQAIKVGGGFAAYRGLRRSQPSATYRFANLQAYLDARNGVNRRSYIRYDDTIGDLSTRLNAVFWNVFVQDEWRMNRRLRLNAGLRYDLFLLPDADPTAAYLPSRKFTVDKNNFGPRLGLAFALVEGRRPAVLRASAGVYYDPPILNYYDNAVRFSGNSRAFSFSLTPSNGPDFPNRFQGQATPPSDIQAIDPNFKTMSSLHANLQLEKALTEDLSFTAGYSHSSGRHIPTKREVNCQPTGGTLADGRPLYGTAATPCAFRMDPRFGSILVWESVGNLNYNAAAFILTQRFSAGYQFSFNYTLARSRDDAPEENIQVTAIWQSDPSNRRHDRGRSISHQTHTLAATFLGRPRIKVSNRFLNYVANHNQFAIIARASDGEVYNILAAHDLNRDNSFIDRPVGIPRNLLKTEPFFNVDLRYSRYISLSERQKLELFVDITNLTNTNSVVSFTRLVLPASLVNPGSGELTGPLPDFRTLGVTSTDSRRMQLGLKLYF